MHFHLNELTFWLELIYVLKKKYNKAKVLNLKQKHKETDPASHTFKELVRKLSYMHLLKKNNCTLHSDHTQAMPHLPTHVLFLLLWCLQPHSLPSSCSFFMQSVKGMPLLSGGKGFPWQPQCSSSPCTFLLHYCLNRKRGMCCSPPHFLIYSSGPI